MTPIGARVLIDCDGGAVPCEVVAHDELRGMVRMRMVLPGQKRDGLMFWRPADAAPSSARAIQPAGREDGDLPSRGNGSAAEGAGSWAPRPAGLMGWIGRGSRAGVITGRLPGRALLAAVAAIGLAALARDARRLHRARGVVRAYRAGGCPL